MGRDPRGPTADARPLFRAIDGAGPDRREEARNGSVKGYTNHAPHQVQRSGNDNGRGVGRLRNVLRRARGRRGGSIQPDDAANLASGAKGELEKVETRRHRTSGVIATIPEDCLAAGGTLALDQRADPRTARRIHAGGDSFGER